MNLFKQDADLGHSRSVLACDTVRCRIAVPYCGLRRQENAPPRPSSAPQWEPGSVKNRYGTLVYPIFLAVFAAVGLSYCVITIHCGPFAWLNGELISATKEPSGLMVNTEILRVPGFAT